MAFAGKKALVLGGTSGIGLATCRLLVSAGAQVQAFGRSEDKIASANAEMAARSGAQGLQHMWVMWATTTAAIGEAVAAFEAAKDNKGRAKALEPLGPLLEVWGRMDTLNRLMFQQRREAGQIIRNLAKTDIGVKAWRVHPPPDC